MYNVQIYGNAKIEVKCCKCGSITTAEVDFDESRMSNPLTWDIDVSWEAKKQLEKEGWIYTSKEQGWICPECNDENDNQ